MGHASDATLVGKIVGGTIEAHHTQSLAGQVISINAKMVNANADFPISVGV
ncbi:hypothetical protein AC519_2575 [Pseudomonas savastanoi]|nr:hypothetical protein AC519_2575 [Pseudomonas savastanoi]